MGKRLKSLIKQPLIFLAAFIVFTLLHNAIYAIFKFEEPILFFFALASFLAFVINASYRVFLYIKAGKSALAKTKRALLVGFIITILALDWAALDDITTGSQPSYTGEYAVLAASTIIFAALISIYFRTKKKG